MEGTGGSELRTSPGTSYLSLTDHAQRVGDYHVDYYGLTLRENP